jgi:hypothetical protein
MSAVEARRYEFGSAGEDDTLLAGLRAGQLGIVALALVIAVLTIRRAATPMGFAASGIVLAVAAAAAFWHVGGRTVEQWLPVAARWLGRVVTRRTRHLSALPLLGETTDGKPNTPPDTLAGVEILSAPLDGDRGPDIGIICDRRAAPTRRCCRSAGGASNWLTRRRSSGGWLPGARSWPAWHGRRPRSTGSSGSSGPFPTTATRWVATWPAP